MHTACLDDRSCYLFTAEKDSFKHDMHTDPIAIKNSFKKTSKLQREVFCLNFPECRQFENHLRSL